jgi:Fe-S-cluster-containing dehydrogenase component
MRHATHFRRLFVLLALAGFAFVSVRAKVVPKDFGTLGHFRASAITEAAAREPRHIGSDACSDCHAKISKAWAEGKHHTPQCENGFGEDLPGRNRPKTPEQLPVRGFFVPKLCNHCINTPCIQVCPVGASYKTKEGVVLVDPQRCVGCGYCVQACPFGSRFLNPETKVADKCTWCYHRITKGLKPACVVSCPAKARIFGNVNDHKSEISQILATNRVQVLKSYLGTNPRTRYIGLDSEVI